MYTIVCPSRLYHYFRHFIILFRSELDVDEVIIEDPESIFQKTGLEMIVFGMQEFWYFSHCQQFLKKNRIYVYNTEQLPTHQWDHIITSEVTEWWDYSTKNLEYLAQKHFPKPLRHLYPCFSESICLPLRPTLDRRRIVFFGTHHPRRQEICERLQLQLPEFQIVYDTTGDIIHDRYDELVSSHMVYLNLHYYVPSILEIARIFPLLCQGHLVLSECSDDHSLDALFGPFLVWFETLTADELRQKIWNHDNTIAKEHFRSFLLFRDVLKKRVDK